MTSDAYNNAPLARRIIRKPGLKAMGIEFTNAWLIELERRGKFPQRIQLSENTVGWYEHEIVAWLDARAAARAPVVAA